MSSSSRLTPKQRLFVEHYLIHFNGTKAAMDAGYSRNPDSARAHATKMLAKAHISEAVKIGQRRQIEKFEVDQDMVVAGLAAIAFTNLDDVAPWDERGNMLIASADLPWRVRASIKGLRVRRTRRTERRADEDWEVEEFEVRMHDRVAALKLLGQHVGMRFGGPRINVEPGGTANVDARNQSLLNVYAKLEDMDPDELIKAAMAMPREEDGE